MEPIVEPHENALWTRVGDEIVLLVIGQQSAYHGLRGAAIRIWELIDERAHGPEAIVQALLREFEADEAEVRADVAATLEGLAERSLIRER